MKPLLCSALLLLTFSLNAQAPAPLAHGDVPGEPHHHLKIENTYVRAYYVEVPAHEETQLHQHDHDYIFVTLGATDVINAVRDKPEVHLVLKDGDVHFSRGGFAHVARNLSDVPFRNVTIEFLHPQGEVHNLCEKIFDGPSRPCHAHQISGTSMDMKRVPAFETEEVKLEVVQINSLNFNLGFNPKHPRVLVALTGALMEVEVGGQTPLPIQPGEVVWFPSGVASRIRARPGFSIGSRYLQFEFKDERKNAKD
jgi:quercetin dioxygenase-like cupin family protein